MPEQKVMNDPVKEEDDSDDPINGIDTPIRIIPDSGDNSDASSDDDDRGNHPAGYEPIPQDPEDPQGLETEVEFEANFDELPPAGPSSNTLEMIRESQNQQKVEEAQERLDLFKSTDKETRDIKLTEEKVEAIKVAMEGFKLPQTPEWANEVSDKEWQEMTKKLTGSQN